MPIYEFYCKKCNTVYKFYSRTIDTSTIPKCPGCKRVKLERIFSSFATLTKKEGVDSPEAGIPDIDETKLERAMAMLEKEAEGMDENDPGQAADLMRKLTDAAGISLGEGMEEAHRACDELGLDTIDLKLILTDEYITPGDGHPNQLADKIYADRIIGALKKWKGL